MPGFYVGKKPCNISSMNLFNESCLAEDYHDNYFYARNTVNKFMDDKCFVFTDAAAICVDGVLLNKCDLFSEFDCKDVASLCFKMYGEIGDCFFSRFRGPFSGFFHDKKNDKLIIFTNHTGAKPVYYLLNKNIILAGSEIKYLVECCKLNGIKLTFDESAAYQMLSFGFMIDDATCAKEIKRLQPGGYIVIERGTHEIRSYAPVKKNRERFAGCSDDEIIEEIDKCFSKAVTLEYKKDEEYGLKHLAELSGGLDSRMSMWVAHESTDRHISCIEFGKAGYLDEIIAKEIAYFWKDELLIKPLDDMSFLYDIDIMTQMLGGRSLYVGSTGVYRYLNLVNIDRFGIIHTGEIGDVVLGCYGSKRKDGGVSYPVGAYSQRFLFRIKDLIEKIKNGYEDEDLYLLYTRGMRGVCNPHQIYNNFTEVTSPFLDYDFFRLCIDIPVEKRANHYIYKKWILRKHIEAAKFKWEKIDDTMTESKIRLNIWRMKRKIQSKLKIGKFNSTNNMNPLDVWLSNDHSKEVFLDNYFQQSIEWLHEIVSAELFEDMVALYSKGNVVEKSQVLTIISATKQFLI